jgi:hypothetical protein
MSVYVRILNDTYDMPRPDAVFLDINGSTWQKYGNALEERPIPGLVDQSRIWREQQVPIVAVTNNSVGAYKRIPGLTSVFGPADTYHHDFSQHGTGANRSLNPESVTDSRFVPWRMANQLGVAILGSGTIFMTADAQRPYMHYTFADNREALLSVVENTVSKLAMLEFVVTWNEQDKIGYGVIKFFFNMSQQQREALPQLAIPEDELWLAVSPHVENPREVQARDIGDLILRGLLPEHVFSEVFNRVGPIAICKAILKFPFSNDLNYQGTSLAKRLEQANLHTTRDGRLWHVMSGEMDKGSAIERLLMYYPFHTDSAQGPALLAGGNSPIDASMAWVTKLNNGRFLKFGTEPVFTSRSNMRYGYDPKKVILLPKPDDFTKLRFSQ